MSNCMKLQASNPKIKVSNNIHFLPENTIVNTYRRVTFLRRPSQLRSLSLTLRNSHETDSSSSASIPSVSSSHFTSSVGSPPSLQWNFSNRQITVLNVAACAVAISTTWLFCSAIPTLLAFKRAAESLEKLLDVTREELPDTMAAVRLSGMEISDLTMELSDLGQEITQGVKSSTRVVRVAEERLRRLTNMAPPGGSDKAQTGATNGTPVS